jgi:hypothetical protein
LFFHFKCDCFYKILTKIFTYVHNRYSTVHFKTEAFHYVYLFRKDFFLKGHQDCCYSFFFNKFEISKRSALF